MEDYKIAKLQKIKEVNNSMCHNFYFLAYFRLYNKEHTKYKRGKFIVSFDIFDLQEYFLEEDEERGITKEEIREYASEIACNDLSTYYRSFEDTKDLLNFCNETIEYYNKVR